VSRAPVLASHRLRGSCLLLWAGLRCRLSRACCSSCLARVGVHRTFVLCRVRGSLQRGARRQRLVPRAQATNSAALPGFQSSAIVLLTDGVACCRLTSHSSGRLRRRLTPTLGGQNSILLWLRCVCHFWLRIGCAGHVVSGWPALSSFARSVVRRGLRALAHLASSCVAMRAVFRNVAFVVSGSFFARRPQPSRHCRAFKAALSCCLPTAQRVPSNQSFKRTAPPPLNSSVRPLLGSYRDHFAHTP